MTNKKGITQKSSTSKSQPDYTRPLSHWRRIECEEYAKEQGIELTSTTVKRMREELENLNKKGKIEFPHNNNKQGGSRKGAGRKPDAEIERLNILKERAENHALEEVDIRVVDGTTIKKVSKTRDLALLDTLFNEGFKNKNINAIREYFDRTRGKARQPLEHSGTINTEDQYIPDNPAIQNAYEVFKKERRKMIAKGYYGEYE